MKIANYFEMDFELTNICLGALDFNTDAKKQDRFNGIINSYNYFLHFISLLSKSLIFQMDILTFRS